MSSFPAPPLREMLLLNLISWGLALPLNYRGLSLIKTLDPTTEASSIQIKMFQISDALPIAGLQQQAPDLQHWMGF